MLQKKQTRQFSEENSNAVSYLLNVPLAILTFGVWILVVWYYRSTTGSLLKWRCVECGTMNK